MSCLGVTGEVSKSKQFQWSIADFFSLSDKKGDFYTSPTFMSNNSTLRLSIFPGGCHSASTRFISVFLENETLAKISATRTLHIKKGNSLVIESRCGRTTIEPSAPMGIPNFYVVDYVTCGNITFHIKKNDGTLIGSGSAEATIKPSCIMGIRNFYDRSELEQRKSELVPSGFLTILCTLKPNQDGRLTTVTVDEVETVNVGQVKQTSPWDHRRLTELDVLSENLRHFSTNKDSCDVTLEVEDKEFKAHKAILMARSPVFASMFQHDTLEKQTDFIKIPDCDAESFQEFLDYLYCGKLENVSFRSAFHLYSTSNKYDVQKLKVFCAEYLIQSLSPDNVCDIIQLADKYDDIILMAQIQYFFNENLVKIFPTSEWQKLLKNNYCLANKLLIEYSKAKAFY